MFVFLLVVFAGFVAFSLYSRRFANPYKLIFIFGKKGAGKSTLMVRCMLRDLKKGWHVYTDIQDCIVPGVRIITSADLAKFRPDANSALYLDEVGIAFDNRSYKSFDTGLRDFFKLQRKYKCKVVMNSQSFDVDKKIRDVTDSMILQTAIGNVLTLSRPIRRSVTLCEATAQADSRIADNLKFESIFKWRVYFMPKYFKYFESFNAPERPAIPFREIPAIVKDIVRNDAEKSVADTYEDEYYEV